MFEQRFLSATLKYFSESERIVKGSMSWNYSENMLKVFEQQALVPVCAFVSESADCIHSMDVNFPHSPDAVK